MVPTSSVLHVRWKIKAYDKTMYLAFKLFFQTINNIDSCMLSDHSDHWTLIILFLLWMQDASNIWVNMLMDFVNSRLGLVIMLALWYWLQDWKVSKCPKLTTTTDYYDWLGGGLTPTSPLREIEDIYYERVMLCHPDKNEVKSITILSLWSQSNTDHQFIQYHPSPCLL